MLMEIMQVMDWKIQEVEEVEFKAQLTKEQELEDLESLWLATVLKVDSQNNH